VNRAPAFHATTMAAPEGERNVVATEDFSPVNRVN